MPMPRVAEHVEREVAAAYVGGESMPALSRRFGISTGTVHRIVHSAGITARRIDPVAADLAARAAAEYAAGGRPADIAARLGIAATSVRNCVRRSGSRLRKAGSPRRYPMREDAFDAPLSDDARYWVGMLLADGCTHDGKLTFCLASKDAAHVIAFASFLATSAPITIRPNNCWALGGTSHAITVCSRRLTDALASLGITPNKSARERMCSELAGCRDAWRGFVDGDGWLRSKRTQAEIGVCGSLAVCEQFVEFTKPAMAKKPIGRNGSIWKAVLTGLDARRAVARLYEGAGVALERKRLIASRIIAVHREWGGRRPYHGGKPPLLS